MYIERQLLFILALIFYNCDFRLCFYKRLQYFKSLYDVTLLFFAQFCLIFYVYVICKFLLFHFIIKNIINRLMKEA